MATSSRTKMQAWSAKDLIYVAKEFAGEQRDRKSARECAFRIGQRLDRILSAEGRYGKGLLKKFLVALLTRKKVAIKEQTAYGYLHFYRGAGTIENARRLDVPQKYWEILGTDRWGDDIFSEGLVQWFREHPLLEADKGKNTQRIGKQRAGNPSPDKLSSVIDLLEAHRARLKAIDPDAETDMGRMATASPKKCGKGYQSQEIEMSEALPSALAMFQYDLSLLAGEHVRSLPLTMSDAMANRLGLGKGGDKYPVKIPAGIFSDMAPKPNETEMSREYTAEAIARSRGRETAEIEIVQGAPVSAKRMLNEVLKHGDARKVLRSDWISPNTLDVVLTDPPYGKYAPWREATRIEHNAEDTAEGNARMVADVASIIVQRKLHKPRFVWLSFCPTDLIHIFAPPLLKAFEPLKPMYQVLIWDKAVKPPSGGIQAFSTQCESILCFSFNRPLPATHPMSPIYIERQDQQDENWKPVRLIKRLIADYTYEQGRMGRASGQVVLDPFCGKGGTGLAALFSGVDFRLIDSHKGQYSDARISLMKAMSLLDKAKRPDTAWAEYLALAKKNTKAKNDSE